LGQATIIQNINSNSAGGQMIRVQTEDGETLIYCHLSERTTKSGFIRCQLDSIDLMMRVWKNGDI
jgi:hypothetical protein